jgi:glycosyltransferase involved in cell wall biosynthesis
VRIALDATPLLGVRTGIGRYVEHLLAELATTGADEIAATAFTMRGAGGLPPVVPPAVAVRHRPVPARVLRELWARLEAPPVEWLAGPADVFHGTNFVLPPLRQAAGVVTVHDLSYLRTPQAVEPASLRYRALVPRSLRRAAVVCTPTRAVADEVVAEYGLAEDAVAVTPLGVDEPWLRAEPPPPAWLAAHRLPDRYLLFVGSREPRKGLPTLLAAYRELVAGDRDVPPLVLVGPAGWGGPLDLTGLPAGSVLTPGYLDMPALRGAVAGAACLAFPSVYEGFGLPPLEALACGTPVVASDLPATREVLGGQAALVPAGDAAALASALAGVLAEDGGPAARAARRAQAARFTWVGCAAATRAAYRTALSRGSPARRRPRRGGR